MSSVLDMANEDADNKPKVATDDDKAKVSKLALQIKELELEVEKLENDLSEKKSELRRVEENDLPEAMDAIGMSEFKLTDGSKISVKPYYTASIPLDKREDAYQWLEEKGHGSIIKTEVSVSFGKGQMEIAKEFQQFARGFNVEPVDPELSRSVHAQTLKAFVKESIEDGGEVLPSALFTTYVGRKAKVVNPPKKRGT